MLSLSDLYQLVTDGNARELRRWIEEYPGQFREIAHEIYLRVLNPEEYEQDVPADDTRNPAPRDEWHYDFASWEPNTAKSDILRALATVADPTILLEEHDHDLLTEYLEQGDQETARAILDNGAPTRNGDALEKAIELGEVAIARRLIEGGSTPPEWLGQSLQYHPREMAELLFENGTKFRHPGEIVECVKCGSAKLAQGCIRHFQRHPELPECLQQGLLTAANRRSREMVELLLYNGATLKGPTEGSGPLIRLLLNHRDDTIAFGLLKKGVLASTQHPLATVQAVKCAALGLKLDPANATVFDKCVVPLRAHDRLKYRVPYYEGLTEQDIKDQTPNYREFLAFAEVLRLAHYLARAIDSEHPDTPSPFFTRLMARTQKKQWEDEVRFVIQGYEPARCKDFADCLNYVTKVVIMPEFVRQTKDHAGHIDYLRAHVLLKPKMAAHIVGERSMTKLLDLGIEWHKALNELDQMRAIALTTTWPALTPDYKARNGCVVTFLTSGRELQDEGLKQRHCTGTLVSDCAYGDAHIASIRRGSREGGTLSTAKLIWDGNHKIWDVDHRVFGNIETPDDDPAFAALADFMDAFRAGSISINAREIKAEKRKALARFRGGHVAEWIGFNPLLPPEMKRVEWWTTHQECREKLVESSDTGYLERLLEVHIKDHPLIAGGRRKWAGKPAKAFLEETGLMEDITALAQNPPLKGRTSHRGRAGIGG